MMPYNSNEGLLSPQGANGFGRLLMRQGAVNGTPGDQNGPGGGPMPLPDGDQRGPGGGPMPLPPGKRNIGPVIPTPGQFSPLGNAPGGPWGGNPNSYGPSETPGDGPPFGGGGPMPLPPAGWDMNALAQTNPQSIFGGPPKTNPTMPGPPQSYGPSEGPPFGGGGPMPLPGGPIGFQPRPRGGSLGDPGGGPVGNAPGGPWGGNPNSYGQEEGNPAMGRRVPGDWRTRALGMRPQEQSPSGPSFEWGLPRNRSRF